ncbi:MAG: coproporphyrinogen III oxidase, partial [bacterium]|nr:coproporphyrinogen III oxidase [bacterium]
MFAGAVEEFLAAGYAFVGFDHFAKPNDDLAIAMEARTLHRNFMGYTVMPASDQVGVGVTAIGDVGGAYTANDKKLASYYRRISESRLPIERGIVRTEDDDLRGSVIRRIICTLHLEYAWVEKHFNVDPRQHFSDALAELEPMVGDGLVELDSDELRVTPLGRFFLRNVCMPFDAYLKHPTDGPVYS